MHTYTPHSAHTKFIKLFNRSGAICSGGDLDGREARFRGEGAACAEGDKERHRHQPKSERHRHFAEKSLYVGVVVTVRLLLMLTCLGTWGSYAKLTHAQTQNDGN